MDNWEKQVGELHKRQLEITASYEEMIKSYEKSDLNVENTKLKAKLADMEGEYQDFKKRYKQLEEETSSLKIALQDQMAMEKLRILQSSKEKLDEYFSQKGNQTMNRLNLVKNEATKRLEELTAITQRELMGDEQLMMAEIQQLQGKIEQHIRAKRMQFASQINPLQGQMHQAFNQLEEEPVSEEVLQKRMKANTLEVKIGLNWINKLGIILMLIGIVTFMNYAYNNFFTPMVKGTFGYMLGLIFLGGGFYFQKKSKKVFATGLTGGAIAIFYITTFMSYFTLKIMPVTVALVLCVLMSIVAYVLATTYESKTIGAFALVGGYLPLVAYGSMMGLEGGQVYVAMGYVVLLNLVTLALATVKNWRVLIYMSFVCNMPAAILLTLISPNVWVAIGYVLVNFCLYTASHFIYPIKQKDKMTDIQVVLLGIHTLCSCALLYYVMSYTVLKDLKGLVALVFCVLYIGFERLSKKYLPEEKGTAALFYLTALTFAILIIPFQFGAAYLSIGWLVEGLLLTLYGIYRKQNKFKISGYSLLGLGLVCFYFNDGFYKDYWIKFTCVIITLMVLLVVYIRRSKEEIMSQKEWQWVTFYKYVVCTHLWVYLTYIGIKIASQWILVGAFEQLLIFETATLIVAVGLLFIKALKDQYTIQIVWGLSLIAMLGCTFTDFAPNLVGIEKTWVYGGVLGVYNGLLVMFIAYLIRTLQDKSRRFYTTSITLFVLYIIFNVTGILSSYYDIGFETMTISLLYVVIAALCIGIGFKWRLPQMRYLGLVLSVIATGKLFIFDIGFFVSPFLRIVSYFSFGIVLIGISYIYQRFAKKEGEKD